jgi:hypothetical protein
MRTLSGMLGAAFKAPAVKKPDTHRRAREEAKRLAALCGCEIEKCSSGGWNVWPPKASVVDPFDGDHYAQDWAEVLVMVAQYAKADGHA